MYTALASCSAQNPSIPQSHIKGEKIKCKSGTPDGLLCILSIATD